MSTQQMDSRELLWRSWVYCGGCHPLSIISIPVWLASQADAREVTRELLKRYLGLVLALNEACVLVLGGRRLLLRVTATDTLDAESQEEQLGYHCYRGGDTGWWWCGACVRACRGGDSPAWHLYCTCIAPACSCDVYGMCEGVRWLVDASFWPGDVPNQS